MKLWLKILSTNATEGFFDQWYFMKHVMNYVAIWQVDEWKIKK